MAIPNGHLFGGGGSGSMSDSGLPPRPLYPRTNYTPQPMPPLNPPYASSTPRVNITSGELSAPSSGTHQNYTTTSVFFRIRGSFFFHITRIGSILIPKIFHDYLFYHYHAVFLSCPCLSVYYFTLICLVTVL